ncbi:MAG: hypothetical protein JXA08_05720 [Methanomicrobiaceae archaeon]|nr:hypothetical protein [Methanomicrobiaceae archaeon]
MCLVNDTSAYSEENRIVRYIQSEEQRFQQLSKDGISARDRTMSRFNAEKILKLYSLSQTDALKSELTTDEHALLQQMILTWHHFPERLSPVEKWVAYDITVALATHIGEKR